VSVLGPGQRAVVWVQGCRFACKNCIVPDSWDETAGELVTVAELTDWILAQPGIEGVTFSGGEPMLQAEALSHLVECVRNRSNLGVVCYTGYRLEYLQQQGTSAQQAFLQQIDLLIDGVYLEQQHGDLLWRGSANQRLLPLSERYQTLISNLLDRGDRSVGLEFFMEETGEVGFVGVPNQPGFYQEFVSRMLNHGVIINPYIESTSFSS
jgi:anaerobic ribonucleoside-triphosphate reductase activating protein